MTTYLLILGNVLFLGALKVTDTAIGGIKQFNLDFSEFIGTPALRITSSLLSPDATAEDMELDNLPSSVLHPACIRYFMIKSSKKAPDFDPTKRHPAFFTAQYERRSSRHSSFGIDVTRMIANDWKEGMEYRKMRNVTRCTAVPPEDELPCQKKKVVFVAPPKLRPDRLLARATILRIVLSELPRMSLLVSNSPFVEISCGSFRSTTEVNSLAGDRATWDDMNWNPCA